MTIAFVMLEGRWAVLMRLPLFKTNVLPLTMIDVHDYNNVGSVLKENRVGLQWLGLRLPTEMMVRYSTYPRDQ